MTAISWLDEQILALDQIVDRVMNPLDSDTYANVSRAPDRPWICQAIGTYTHPYRITNGTQDLGHYATLENAQRALAEMT